MESGGGEADYPPLRSWKEVNSMVWTETLKLWRVAGPLRSWKEVNSMVWTETLKLWRVAGPLALQIMCHFGIESLATVFVGHIGNLELSAVSVSLSIIGTFTYGFLVPFLFPPSLSLSLSLSLPLPFSVSVFYSL